MVSAPPTPELLPSGAVFLVPAGPARSKLLLGPPVVVGRGVKRVNEARF